MLNKVKIADSNFTLSCNNNPHKEEPVTVLRKLRNC